jgi:hypothetical protein
VASDPHAGRLSAIGCLLQLYFILSSARRDMVLVQLFLQEPAPDGMARPPRSPAGFALAADAIQAAYNLQRLLVKLYV